MPWTLAALAATLSTEPATAMQSAVLETRYYSFHSDPWINLHHFLYQWARADLGVGQGRQEVPVPERDGPGPTGAQGEAWARARAFYRDHVARRDHFDGDMLELKIGLIELGGDPGAEPPDRIEGIADVLRAAMPVYLDLWWPAHDAANRRFIDHVGADVARYEGRWVETVSRLFGGSWLDGRLRVDASAYANWQGGYTSNGPPHTVVWSTDEANLRGLYGLELVFHESGHMSSLGTPLRRTVGALFREAGVEEPGNLRHALLFASSGELVRTIASERGLPEHVPYIVSEGLTGFAGWAPLWPPILEHWMPVVHGRADRMEALRALVEAFRTPPAPPGGP